MNLDISSASLTRGITEKRKRRKVINTIEVVGMGIMIAGIILLFQPFGIQLFKWGFPFLLIGYTVYNVFAHIPR
ncbi:MAG: hypothetical protein HPY68_07205 [Candidatus Atribacteria bacterium]|nr:hypothetical protein [Candidatus Atribacteria bacterium]